MWKVFTLCIALSIGLVLWLGYEVGAVFPRVEAAETAPATKEAGDKSVASAVEQAYQERDKALKQRQENLDRREQMLMEKDKILSTQVERYEKIISEYKSRLVEQDAERKSRTDSARQVYEKMEPKRAAKILEQMDLSVATSLIIGMRGEKAAGILSLMSPERARNITERYLGRKIASSKLNESKPITDGVAPDATPNESAPQAPSNSGVPQTPKQ
jgi:flagellar motility protein MotE (MotC chaperone)